MALLSALSQDKPQGAIMPSDMEATYVREALKLLCDEYVWFSVEDIHDVFQHDRQYATAWETLDDADSEGAAATRPIRTLPQRRQEAKAVQDVNISSVQNPSLRAELQQVRKKLHRRNSEYGVWANGLFYSYDQDGKEQLLDVDGAQVMMEWERPYMLECVDELGINADSDVLEVGFGCGYSSNRIQQYRPRTHTIIECADSVLRRLRTWAADHPGVIVVDGTWQERLPELGTFTHVFFDDYGTPGRSDREMEENCPNASYVEEYKKAPTHFHAFLNIVMRFHSKEGTRFTGYLESPIEVNCPGVTAHYRWTAVEPPRHCNYWPVGLPLGDRAVVPLFTKTAERLGDVRRSPDAARLSHGFMSSQKLRLRLKTKAGKRASFGAAVKRERMSQYQARALQKARIEA